ncbi:hypothetical protein DUNSADRAFT_7845 [Dunaliella salina]|uniref:Encoded protein n=1 Tax=Dunaliella salina TaxID=3046 RepID=A0ABQ7GKL5_DUNSA|nr:hypothetical protein DUNSADRAFT_7845 [Dunaliella salina]|eukprot:KAF5835126.1 hypothetical protein DUNSADRAFT_7845 [Dunaliella salina]
MSTCKHIYTNTNCKHTPATLKKPLLLGATDATLGCPTVLAGSWDWLTSPSLDFSRSPGEEIALIIRLLLLLTAIRLLLTTGFAVRAPHDDSRRRCMSLFRKITIGGSEEHTHFVCSHIKITGKGARCAVCALQVLTGMSLP